MKQQNSGFTLIELMIVVAIIGILSTMAVPTYQNSVIRTQVSEALNLSTSIKAAVTEYYQMRKHFPTNNQTLGLADSQHFMGNFVTAISVEDGAIHIHLGNRINALAKGKVLSLRPATVSSHPENPISWVCGYAEVVDGMSAAGQNQTSLKPQQLSPACRSWKK